MGEAVPSGIMIIGASREGLDAAVTSGATSVSVDFEDTVADDDKGAARELAQALLALPRGDYRRSIRINPLTTRLGLEDLLWIADLEVKPDSVTLAKVEDPHEITIYRAVLGDLPASALVEGTAALERVFDIAAAGPPLLSLSLGAKDMALGLGGERTWDGLYYARGRIAQAAKSRGLNVGDGPFRPNDDLDALKSHCLRLKEMGFTGMSTIWPDHVPVINEVFGK